MTGKDAYRTGLTRLLGGGARRVQVAGPGRRRGLRLAASVFIASITITVVVVGLFLARLWQGPVALDFLTPRIQAAIDQEMGEEAALEIGGVVLEQGGSTGLSVRLRDVSVVDENGVALAAVERADFDLDLAALATGAIAPSSIRLQEPRLHLIRTAAGEISVSAAAPDTAPLPAGPRAPVVLSGRDMIDALSSDTVAEPAVALAALVDRLANLARRSGDPRLQVIGIQNADLTYHEGAGEGWRIVGLDATLRRGGADAPVTLAVTGGDAEDRFSIDVTTAVEATTGRRSVSVALNDVRPYRLRLEDSAAQATLLDLPISGQGALVFGPAGDLLEAQGQLRVAALTVGQEAGALRREAILEMSFDPATRTARIAPSHFAFGDSEGILSGHLAWPEAGRENVDGIEVALQVDEALIDQPDVPAPAVGVDRLTFAGRVRPGLGEVEIDQFSLDGSGVGVALSGTVTVGERSPGLRLEARAEPMTVATLKQIWPPFLAKRTRGWVIGHLLEGRIGAARFAADVPVDALAAAVRDGGSLAEDALSLTFPLEGVALSYFGDLPPIRGGRAQGRLTGNGFHMADAGGTVRMRSGAVIEVSEARWDVPRFHGNGNPGHLGLKLAGPASAVVELFEHEPLRGLGQPPVEAETVEGTAEAIINATFILGTDRKEPPVYDIALALSELALPEIQGFTFSEGQVEAEIAPRRMSINGRGMFNGMPATLQLDSDGIPRADDLGRYAVTLLVDENSGEALGVKLPSLTRGPVLVKAEGERSLAGVESVELDLTNASIVFPQVGEVKPAGTAATLAFVPEAIEEGGYLLRDLSLTGGGLAAQGSVRIEEGGTQIDLAQLRLSEGGSASLTGRVSEGSVSLAISGQSFDASPLLRGLVKGGASAGGQESAGRAEIAVNVDRLDGLSGERLDGADVRLRSRAGAIEAFEAQGAFASGGSVSGVVDGDAGARRLAVETGNAGSLLRFLGLYSSLAGGALSLDATMPGVPDGVVPGQLVMRDFRIVGDSSLEQLATSGDTRRGRADLDQARDMPFEMLQIDFQRQAQRISISEGVLRGPFAGGTFNGSVERASGQIDIAGTYVPAYALNNVFSRIPLLGPLLGGREDEGLVGVTFALRGPIERPVLTVNPMSAIAPGLFRRLFEFRTQGAAQGQVN